MPWASFTQLSLREAMLEELHIIEQDMGRNRDKEIRNGPRTLDLDLLLCDALVMDTSDLVLPHPRIAERRFVLIPLLEARIVARGPPHR